MRPAAQLGGLPEVWHVYGYLGEGVVTSIGVAGGDVSTRVARVRGGHVSARVPRVRVGHQDLVNAGDGARRGHSAAA